MLFTKSKPINLLVCQTCRATGQKNLLSCPECHGLALAHSGRGKLLYWGYHLTRFNLALERARRIFNRVRLITVGVLVLNFWFWFVWKSYQQGLFSSPFHLRALFEQGMFWWGVLFALYFWYRLIRQAKRPRDVEKNSYDNVPNVATANELVFSSWPEALKIPRAQRLDIADTFTDEAKMVLGESYRLADKGGYESVDLGHLFYSLLSFNRIANVFIRLGVPSQTIQAEVLKNLPKLPSVPKSRLSMPLPSAELQQVLFSAYEEAYNARQEYVSVTELLLAVVAADPALQDILYGLDIDNQKLKNVVEWVRIRERLFRQYERFRKAAYHRSTKGMDKAMTALQTPFLNQFSEDLTILAQFGHLSACVAREAEIDDIFRVVEGGRQNVLLVGDHGVGKKSIVEGLAQRMVSDDVPNRLKDKRLIRLSTSALLAGTTPAGAVERLGNIMHEIARAGNVILFIHNIHDLIGVSAGAEGGLDVASALAERLANGNFLTFATTTREDFARSVANSAMANVFTKVEIAEMNENQAIQVLESKVGLSEYKNNVFFSYDAIARAVGLARKFIQDVLLPGSALEILAEVATYTHAKKGPNALITGEEVAEVISEKTHVPVTAVSANESEKLLRLEEELHHRVVGQDEAVNLVANALRRARAEIRSESKPIANFLFLGPTGVGKTELAKTIASVYFGGEERMIRLDMSEYQDKTSIYRLIGAPGEKGSGVLTEAVRRQPFALLLLDEMEKADKDILNLFLQVMDDGRLTDSVGRVVDFTNIILIATSNAGTAFVNEELRAGKSSEAIKDELLHGKLADYFHPEFLNRFDGIVLFKELDEAAIRQVAGLMLGRVSKEMDAKGVQFKFGPEALDFLAQVGFDPEFGARPMRRAVQDRVENKLAELILSGKLKRKDTVTLAASGELIIG